MQKTPLKWLALPVMLALLGAGCGSATPATTEVPGRPTAPAAGGSASASRCLNAYYPLAAGSAIKYRTVSGSETVPFTIAVLEHTATDIKLEYTFTVRDREAKITHDLACDNGTVRGRGYMDFAQAFMGIDIDYEVLSMEGEIMPADVRVGSEWTMKTRVKLITADTSPIGQLMNGRISTTEVRNKVVAEESVTVPAGTYRALKIQQQITNSGDISGRPYSNTIESVAWYARDVGLVKSENTTPGSPFVMEALEVTP